MKKEKELMLKKRQNNVEEDLKLAKNFNVGYYIITPLFIGVFLGLFLDNIFKTKPLFILSFLVLGTIASFYNIWKTLKE